MNFFNAFSPNKYLSLLLLISSLMVSACSKDKEVYHSPERNVIRNAALVLKDNLIVPTSLQIFIPCANGGTGEMVFFTGNLHVLTHVTVSGNSFTSKFHFQPQGIKGTGEITGDVYQATGVTQNIESGHFENGKYTSTYINNYKLIGPGANNYYVHETLKLTINANGVVTVNASSSNIDCK